MQSFINDSRPAVTDKLVQMKKAGCTVYVVANSVEATALAKLKTACVTSSGSGSRRRSRAHPLPTGRERHPGHLLVLGLHQQG